MEKSQLIPIILTSFLCLILLWLIFNQIFVKKRKVPPSPSKLPIIGNLHQLGSLPHRDLHSLARKHGPLMLLHFGSVPVLVVSSAHLAREIMKTHDLVFANRPVYKAFKKLLYGCRDVVFSPHGEYWRQMKTILILQMLSNKRVQSFRSIREEETAVFVKKVLESSGPVDLSEMFAKYSNDGIGRAALGKNYNSKNGKKLVRVITDFMELLGVINIGDFIPWLDWINRFNGYDKRLDNNAKEFDQILESLIQERQQTQMEQGVNYKSGEDFMDALLEIYNGNTAQAPLARDSVKSLLMDVFVGGTDTIFTSMEWAMAELLRHPKVMEKLQHEVRGIVGKIQHITEDDLDKMHYLKAVIKEALRCHPPFPLLVPRLASKDVRLKGFDVSAGTVVMINVWTIGRDPISWEDPDEFMPERFLNSSVDFKGLDFDFIPFGAGRRGCPGITFASVAMEFLLANLVHKFDWKLGNGVEAEDLDMSESPGITVHRGVPLLAVATRNE